MARQTARRIHDGLDALLDYVTREKGIVVFRRGRSRKPAAALVPVETDEELEALEDATDTRAARKARRERSIPWKHVKNDRGV